MIKILLRRKNFKIVLFVVFCFTLLQFYADLTFSLYSHIGSPKQVGPRFAKRNVRIWLRRAQKQVDTCASFIYGTLSKMLATLKINMSEKEYYSPRDHNVSNVTVSFLDNGTRVCPESKLAPLAVTLVLSLWEYQSKREAIRNTWASGDYNCPFLKANASSYWKSGNFSEPSTGLDAKQFWNGILRYVFIIGLPTDSRLRASAQAFIEKESLEHGDIVLVDMWDTYRNLTLKVLAGLRWAVDVCSRAQYVIKTDHDVFLHVPKLLHAVTRLENQGVIVGSFAHGRSSYVYRGGPYGIPYEAYPFDNGYPEHVKGGIYFMNMTTARSILRVASYMPYIGVEDLHITGVLRRAAGAKVKGFKRGMYNARISTTSTEVENYINGKRLASHSVGTRAMRTMWQKLQRSVVEC